MRDTGVHTDYQVHEFHQGSSLSKVRQVLTNVTNPRNPERCFVGFSNLLLQTEVFDPFE